MQIKHEFGSLFSGICESETGKCYLGMGSVNEKDELEGHLIEFSV